KLIWTERWNGIQVRKHPEQSLRTCCSNLRPRITRRGGPGHLSGHPHPEKWPKLAHLHRVCTSGRYHDRFRYSFGSAGVTKRNLVRPSGFEPPTFCSGGKSTRPTPLICQHASRVWKSEQRAMKAVIERVF